jgi:hypothetical protein
VRWSGPVQAARGALNLDLREPGSALASFICVFQARPPGSALVGTMSGASFIGPEPRPSTTRIVLVRVPDPDVASLERSNRYLAADTVAADLRELGFAAAGVDHAADLIVRCIEARWVGGLDQVTAAEQSEVASAADALFLGSVAPREAGTDPRRAGRPLHHEVG